MVISSRLGLEYRVRLGRLLQKSTIPDNIPPGYGQGSAAMKLEFKVRVRSEGQISTMSFCRGRKVSGEQSPTF